MAWECSVKLLVFLPFLFANRTIAESFLCTVSGLGLYGLLRNLHAVREGGKTAGCRGAEALAVSGFGILWFLAGAAVFVRLAAGLCIAAFWHDAPVIALCPAVLAVSLFAAVFRRQKFRPGILRAAGGCFWLAAGLAAFAMLYALRDRLLPAILAIHPAAGFDLMFAAVCGGGYELFACLAGNFVWAGTLPVFRPAVLVRFAAVAGILLAERIVFQGVPGYGLSDFPVPAAAGQLSEAAGSRIYGETFLILLLLAGMVVTIAGFLEGLRRSGVRLLETVRGTAKDRGCRTAGQGLAKLAVLALVCLIAAGFSENLSAVSFFRAFVIQLLTPVLCLFLLMSGWIAALYRRFCPR